MNYMENRISIFDFVYAISEAVDLASPLLNSHHKRVAYIACSIAQSMNLPPEEVQDIFLASMLHDIGAFSVEERLQERKPAGYDIELSEHALLGYKLLKGFGPLAAAAKLIKHHHAAYDKTRPGIPLGSHIIHLADRAAMMFSEDDSILAQVPQVAAQIMRAADLYHPLVLRAFRRITETPFFWMEILSPPAGALIIKRERFSKEIANLRTLRSFATIIAQIIDFRSRFTATHSRGVAAVAQELSIIAGFSETECKMMEIAGLLHDLGKLAVPNDILEKKGALSNAELSSIRKHTYYTYTVLTQINGIEPIAAWAYFHHERQDGNGYPFNVKGDDFPLPARVMAVADIMTALLEDRPYRAGMSQENVAGILLAAAESGGIDQAIMTLAIKNFKRINSVRIKAQKEARREYEAFRDILFHV